MSQSRKYVSNADRQRAFRKRQRTAQQEQLSQRGLPSLPALPALPGTPRWEAALGMAHALLRQVSQEMTDYSDQRSERWQQSERAEVFSERLEAVDEVVNQLEQLLN
jgi:hypothetical protein